MRLIIDALTAPATLTPVNEYVSASACALHADLMSTPTTMSATVHSMAVLMRV